MKTKTYILVLSMILVIANTVYVGLVADAQMEAALGSRDSPTWPYKWDVSFTVLFIIELIVRIGYFRAGFCTGADNKWNFLDLVLTASAIFDIVARAYGLSSVNLSFARALRMIRVLRVMRVFRL